MSVLYIGRGSQRGIIIYLIGSEITHLAGEISCSLDSTAEVITSVHILFNGREAGTSDIHLRMSLDVSIAGTANNTIDGSTVEVDIGISVNASLKTATIDILYGTARDARRTIARDTSHLTTAIGLEDITTRDVDSGITANLRMDTVACGKNTKTSAQRVIILALTVDTTPLLRRAALHQTSTKHLVSLYNIPPDIDLHITVHIATLIAAAIDITTAQTEGLILFTCRCGILQYGSCSL